MTHNTTHSERYNIANFMRKLGNLGFQFNWQNISNVIGEDGNDDAKCWLRLADLIEPSNKIDISDVYNWAFANLEGCDEAEYVLYDSILGAIQRYFGDIKE